jgi:hypothetical protein
MESSAYSLARETYATLGVDTEAALTRLAATPISLHCWQGDDVGGFEKPNATLSSGGIQATGNYPGKARTLDELRQVSTSSTSSCPAATASISTPSTATSPANSSTATRSSPSTLLRGSRGPRPASSTA